MSQWHSLYLSSSNASDPFTSSALADRLKTRLTAGGYTLYDPFGLMPGLRAYTDAMKAFVAPVPAGHGGWWRLILAPDGPVPESVCAGLAVEATVLALSLTDNGAALTVYQAGAAVDALTGLTPLLATGSTLEHLRAVLAGNLTDLPAANVSSSPGNLPPGSLPDDVQAMAAKLNPRHTGSMFDKIAGRFLKGDEQLAARALLTQGVVDWHTPGGRQIAGLMRCLGFGASDWREPDYTPLRDAYHLHNRRRRNPALALLPGDAEAMAAVPAALDYLPVFAGK